MYTIVWKSGAEEHLCRSQMIKDTMDKKFGPAWQVVVGKGFSYNVNYEVSSSNGSILTLFASA